MISFIGRSSSLAPLSKAVSQGIASQLTPLMVPIAPSAETAKRDVPYDHQTSEGLKATLPRTPLSLTSAVNRAVQIRFAHTDVQIPDFSEYRRESLKKPTANASKSRESRNAFSYIMVAASGVGAVYGAKIVVHDMVSSMSAAKDVLAVARAEVKLDGIPEGKNMTVKWRGKPLFIRHRSAEEIAEAGQVNISSLRDPQHDHQRTQRPEWLVVVGICTHLGCVPLANAGNFGGYYCPCHGSHYDSSGRIRQGPAPLNLEVPQYQFIDDNTLVVG